MLILFLYKKIEIRGYVDGKLITMKCMLEKKCLAEKIISFMLTKNPNQEKLTIMTFFKILI